jgi:hypothetical protein
MFKISSAFKAMLTLLSGVCIITASCKKVDNATADPTARAVEGTYIGGHIGNNAAVWKNNEPTFLTNYPNDIAASAKRSYVNKVFVYNNDVYALVTKKEGDTYTHVVSKNYTDLYVMAIVNGNSAINVTDLGVYNNDVYVCGSINMSNSGDKKAILWKNNVPQTLPNNEYTDTYCKSMKITEQGDVHILGNTYTTNPSTLEGKIVYWKNGVLSALNLPQFAAAPDYEFNDIEVEGNDIYLCGNTDIMIFKSTAVLWKNNTITKLSIPAFYNNNSYAGSQTFTYANAIFVKNGKVHINGNIQAPTNEMVPIPVGNDVMNWTDNISNALTNNITTSTRNTSINKFVGDVFVKDNKVYSLGGVGFYFEDNTKVNLTGATTASYGTVANSIFVK